MRHVPQLDGVRAVAVLIVMVSHGGLGWLVPGGFGVTLFFFLSGYLITSLLRAEYAASGRIDFGGFYFRRVLRIMPPLYITLLLLTAGNALALFGPPADASAIGFDYVFLSNYAHLWASGTGLPVPLWSLAVEEHFYLLFPVAFLFLLARSDGTSAARLCVLWCAMILALRIVTLTHPESIEHNYYWSHTRLDSILFGCCLALWQNPVMDEGAWKPKHWHAIAALLVIFASFAIRSEAFRATLRYSIQGAALFVIFSYVLNEGSAKLTRLLRSRPLAWIGLLSYTLYLCHLAIFAALKANFHMSPIAAGLIGAPVALGYAYAMHLLVERPILEWRRNRTKSGQPGAVAVQPATVRSGMSMPASKIGDYETAAPRCERYL
jgi:peptidoglycan/LPS O-acetylase OafA/YrhL